MVGAREPESPSRPLIVVFARPGSIGGAGNAVCPVASTRSAWTIRRCAAEYLGVQVVSVSVAIECPGREGSGTASSTEPSFGFTAKGTWLTLYVQVTLSSPVIVMV